MSHSFGACLTMGKAHYSTHPAFSKATVCGKNQFRPQKHHQPDPHFGLHKKTATLRTSGTCSGRSSAVGAMAYLSADRILGGCDENVYLSSSDQVFVCFCGIAIGFLGPQFQRRNTTPQISAVFWGPYCSSSASSRG